MVLKINEPYYFHRYDGHKSYQGTHIIVFIIKLFQFRWFTDCNEWFLYIHLGKKWWRFSSCGFLKGVNK